MNPIQDPAMSFGVRARRRHAARAFALAMAAGAGLAAEAQAQTATVAVGMPSNVLNLSAEASVEVQQDLLTIVLQVVRDGSDAAQVQSQLRQVLDAALVEARKAARPGQVDVRTGAFSMYPRRTSGSGAIAGWQGQGELILEGRDLAAISQLAGRLPGLTVQRLSFGLSREARERVHQDVAAEAIAKFKARALGYAQAFGFAGFSVREVSISGGDVQPHAVQPMMLRASMAKASSDESQPIEAGKATVTVSVNGSVQMSAR